MARKATTEPAANRIATEMAELSRERGTGLTDKELLAEGYSFEEIKEHSPKAAEILRAMETRVAA
ncbi:hypothetical protein IB237_23435 [Agrobacterium sp. AGB01]|uniref:hypothetical protein n=1 Tax=Agrobacterium sp. AGB01 TaxID=2769302 RepID=UPI00177CB75F|nr:hypothetical protein [Agrobacterium sp. AGB01]MBD9390158.1 hypothetical protein [Agrobacterium sp. AGB01]